MVWWQGLARSGTAGPCASTEVALSYCRATRLVPFCPFCLIQHEGRDKRMCAFVQLSGARCSIPACEPAITLRRADTHHLPAVCLEPRQPPTRLQSSHQQDRRQRWNARTRRKGIADSKVPPEQNSSASAGRRQTFPGHHRSRMDEQTLRSQDEAATWEHERCPRRDRRSSVALSLPVCFDERMVACRVSIRLLLGRYDLAGGATLAPGGAGQVAIRTARDRPGPQFELRRHMFRLSACRHPPNDVYPVPAASRIRRLLNIRRRFRCRWSTGFSPSRFCDPG
jgi:hypothetical protein